MIESLVKHKELKFIFPINDQCKPELLTKLAKNGIKCNKVVMSHTVASDISGLDINSYDMVALYSKAEVKAFAEAYSGEGCKVATFGVSTAMAAKEAGLSVDLAVPVAAIPSIATGIDKYLTADVAGENLDVFKFKPIVAENKKISKIMTTRVAK